MRLALIVYYIAIKNIIDDIYYISVYNLARFYMEVIRMLSRLNEKCKMRHYLLARSFS